MRKIMLVFMIGCLLCACSGTKEKEKEKMVLPVIETITELEDRKPQDPVIISDDLFQKHQKSLSTLLQDQLFFVVGKYDYDTLKEEGMLVADWYDINLKQYDMIAVYFQDQKPSIHHLIRIEECEENYVMQMLKEMKKLNYDMLYLSDLKHGQTLTLHLEQYQESTITQGDCIRYIVLGIQSDGKMHGDMSLEVHSAEHGVKEQQFAGNRKDKMNETEDLIAVEDETDPTRTMVLTRTRSLSFPITLIYNMGSPIHIEYRIHKQPNYTECVNVIGKVVRYDRALIPYEVSIEELSGRYAAWDNIRFTMQLFTDTK